MGADMVELDVRRSADGYLVVHHDAHLDDGRAIVDLAAPDLPPGVALIGPALDACEGMGVNIEIKNAPTDPDFDPDHWLADAVTAVLDERAEGSRVLVSSFNLATVDRVRAIAPGIATGVLTLAGWDQFKALDLAAERGHSALHPEDPAVTTDLVDAAHAVGVIVNVYTVDDVARIVELARMGVDGIVTNVPDVALAALGHADR